MTKKIPERVKLREERRWIPINWDSIHDIDPAGEWQEYHYRGDAELDSIIASANGDPQEAFQKWSHAVGPKLRRREGPHLVPGPIQEILALPVRQIYLSFGEMYRIEADGRVTSKLL